MDKKRSERDILDMVFDEARYAEIVDSECPDFRIRYGGPIKFFGVEITEFYDAPANARLRNIPNYFTDVIEHDIYRHKDDLTTLRAEEMTIVAPDGTVKATTRGIIQKPLMPEQHANGIAAVIQSKDDRFRKYDMELDHINLIIRDHVLGSGFISVDKFYEYFYTPQVKEALFTSAFREIFLVTQIIKGRNVYVPLKTLLLLAEFHMFGTLVMEYPWEISTERSRKASKDDRKNLPVSLYSKYLRSKTDKVFVRSRSGQLEVILGGCGFTFEGGEKAIFDYTDHPLPDDARLVDLDEYTSLFRSEKFREQEKAILAGHTFRTELAFEVRKQ